MKVAIVVTTYRNPGRLSGILHNMTWAGMPDIPVYVIEDPSPFEDRDKIRDENQAVCNQYRLPMITRDAWGCMQGAIETAFAMTDEDWLIYVPDDVRFPRGGLWNELAGVLTYGRDWVGCIQAPYWNATDLVDMGILLHREQMWDLERVERIPRNPHWEGHGVPRKYINVNGAGFSMSRKLYNTRKPKQSFWPMCTWRLDEWAGYQAWKQGMVCITLPGPPRVHYFGGATPHMPNGLDFHSVEAWKRATGGFTPQETGNETVLMMQRFPDEDWDDMLRLVNSHA